VRGGARSLPHGARTTAVSEKFDGEADSLAECSAFADPWRARARRRERGRRRDRADSSPETSWRRTGPKDGGVEESGTSDHPPSGVGDKTASWWTSPTCVLQQVLPLAALVVSAASLA
jgi:hypothetical protein